MNAADRYATFKIKPRPPHSPVRAAMSWVLLAGLIVRQERAATWRRPLRERLRGWRHGFFGVTYALYDLDRHDPRDYISDFEFLQRFWFVNDPFNWNVRNKLALSRTLTLQGFRAPAVYGLLDRGVVRALDGTATVIPALAWLQQRLLPGGRVVFKPAAEGQGRGIAFISRDERGFLVNGIQTTEEQLEQLLGTFRAYVITEFMEQAPYAAAIFPAATNTVRVLTLQDVETHRPFIAAAAHRIGSTRGGAVDNFHRGLGGLSAAIDIDTGVLGPGATLTADGRLEWHDRHPETGAAIAGVRVEHWRETVDTLLDIAARFPEAPAVGWDLVVTREGPCVLEGNSPPSVGVWQVHRPLLRDPRVRRFYAEYGVLKGARRSASRARAAV